VENYILSTSKLNIGYKTKQGIVSIAKHLNLKLQSGKLITVVGANGSGKSTLLRTLSGIQKPLSGEIYINSKSINSFSNQELSQNLSLVLTEKLPPSNLSVYELVSLGRQPYTNWIGKLSEIDLEKIIQAINLTGIDKYIHKKHYEISDGQMQNTLIARALVQDTPLIILDEPTTHLDLVHKVSLFKLLNKLAKETGKCILFSTHDLDLSIQFSDQIIIINAEEVIQDEPCNLISKGVFNNLFQSESIIFDNEKGKFIYL
jgi:iron complex transport system ATP-binding protein